MAQSLSNLGLVAQDRGELAVAKRQLLRAFEIAEERAPGSLELARYLNNLGVVIMELHDLVAAEDFHRRALAIRTKLVPGTKSVATNLHDLGEVAHRRGNLVAAEEWFQQALTIWEKRAPASSWEAKTLHSLGKLHRERQLPTQALAFFRRALDALESQMGRLGGGQDTRGGFLAQYGHFYQDTIELLVTQGKAEEGFHVLELSRARGLLALFAERDLVFGVDVSPELQRERQLAHAEHDRIIEKLHQHSAKYGDEAYQELRGAVEKSRLHQEEIRSKIRLESPRLAAELYPEPWDLAATQSLLEPGERLLSYSIGGERSFLYVVGSKREDFAVYELETHLESLRAQVQRFRASLQPVSPPEQARFAGSFLTNTLLRPALSHIGQAERLIFVPDGPLHYLPFAALPDPGSREARYLVESKPLSVVASATVLAELRQRRPKQPAPSLAAFGAPHYPASASTAPETTEVHVRAATQRGLDLTSLPFSRDEVEDLGRLFPDHSQIYLGAQATEERAKSLGESASIVHFATHGLIDEEQPLESALALSIPDPWQEGEENGLLQAWEIYEQLRLDADLVTLSACETALGKAMAGEGILGLTRAFQFAGARSVLASLWAVEDQSTSELMKRFYRHLRSGLGKDEALRQAQLELLKGPVTVGKGEETGQLNATHPFYWAAFQVFGDGR